MTILILASLGFVAIHVLPATRLRPRLIALVGRNGYLGGFSLASIVMLIVMVVGYNQAPAGAPLWATGAVLRWLVAALMLVPFWLLVAANSEPNPSAVGGETALETSAAPHGVFTITRHPLMIAIALWAALHLIANPDLPSAIFFGSLVTTALGGARLQDWRKDSEIGAAWRRYRGQTSFMPFAAITQGRTRLDTDDVTWWRLAITLGLWLGMLVFHGPVIGVPALV
jgi:uncharacterized membrane protein